MMVMVMVFIIVIMLVIVIGVVNTTMPLNYVISIFRETCVTVHEVLCRVAK